MKGLAKGLTVGAVSAILVNDLALMWSFSLWQVVVLMAVAVLAFHNLWDWAATLTQRK